jgi:SAM-dependent methyltransferase
VKRDFAGSLRCPFCRDRLQRRLELAVREEDAREVREGELRCGACGRTFPIHKGIPDFVDPTDEVLAREVAGWIQLAGPLSEELVPIMTALPWFPHPPWPYTAPDFFQIFERFDLSGLRVVDLGAGRTWSSRFLAKLGRAREVVAVDVLTTRFLGLETAEIFFQQDGTYFERIRGDIHRLPLPDGWADAVFSCAAIHHSSDLDTLFAEVHRVLAPGGRLLFISEPVKPEAAEGNKPENLAETAAGINENVYSLEEYRQAFARAGLRFSRLAPRSIRHRLLYPDQELHGCAPALIRRLAGTSGGRRLIDRLLRNRLTGDLLYRKWSLPLSGVAWKPE